ncbi:MAG TPA: hypothetical protein VJ124_00740 [Pyrinomonadaceae bacterium]|nr:hypothetical protein [Pyrinomonadaceae bacterium]
MTIAISLKVNDGLVLAADSASTLIGRAPEGTTTVVNIYNNANKIFNLRKSLPIGVITWGSGSIGNASISTLLKDLRRRLSTKEEMHEDWLIQTQMYTIQQVAERLRTFMFEEHYVPEFREWKEKPNLGFIVAGYSSGEAMAEEYQIDIANGTCGPPRLIRPKNDCGITWSGELEAISRLFFGFGTGLPVVLEKNLGVPKDQIGPSVDVLRNALTAPLVVPAMPIQDAIDLAEFLVDLTIKFSRFAPGAPTVGGPIEVAAISKHEGFKWIRRKHYFSREFNPEGI